jgi:hypothetical protein
MTLVSGTNIHRFLHVDTCSVLDACLVGQITSCEEHASKANHTQARRHAASIMPICILCGSSLKQVALLSQQWRAQQHHKGPGRICRGCTALWKHTPLMQVYCGDASTLGMDAVMQGHCR